MTLIKKDKTVAFYVKCRTKKKRITLPMYCYSKEFFECYVDRESACRLCKALHNDICFEICQWAYPEQMRFARRGYEATIRIKAR